ncbi:glycosyltransferase family 39 protein, partial [Patescibacteria group bacterium]|nr:glycosyltransferase family 39 protein [Patescibacteria group bacterium]
MDKILGTGEKEMIWIILTTGLCLRLISLNQSLWLDEAINVMAAKSFSLFGMVTQYAVADFHPPGWFAILWIWGKLFGYSEIAVRLPSVIFGVLTIYITYLIGKKLISGKLGLLAALLLSINPLHIYYSQEARMYSLAAFAVAVNVYLLVKLIKGERVNLIFLISGNLLVLLSDYIAYFIFPAQFIFLILAKKREILKKW